MKIKAFTLVEIMLVLSIFAIVAAIAVPLTLNWQNSEETELVTLTIVDGVRTAQNKARSNVEDSDWGAKVQTDKLIVFKGSDFSTRDQSFDEDFPFSQLVSVSGKSEIVFQKNSGRLPTTSSTQISLGEYSWTISINKLGTVSY